MLAKHLLNNIKNVRFFIIYSIEVYIYNYIEVIGVDTKFYI